jgi:Zn-dependent protease
MDSSFRRNDDWESHEIEPMTGYTRITFLSAFGARAHIHWSALLVMGGMLVASIRSPILALIVIYSFFGIIFLHEAGHAYFAKRLGYRAYDIYLGFVHGQCVYEAPHSEKHECIIAWGGVVAQLVVALPLIVLATLTPIAKIPGVGPVVALLGYVSAMIALINLAPSRGLDGHKAWRLIPILLAERRKPKSNGHVTRGPWK